MKVAIPCYIVEIYCGWWVCMCEREREIYRDREVKYR